MDSYISALVGSGDSGKGRRLALLPPARRCCTSYKSLHGSPPFRGDKQSWLFYAIPPHRDWGPPVGQRLRAVAVLLARVSRSAFREDILLSGATRLQPSSAPVPRASWKLNDTDAAAVNDLMLLTSEKHPTLQAWSVGHLLVCSAPICEECVSSPPTVSIVHRPTRTTCHSVSW